ncbi:MAG: methyltransferase [Oscillospiraceae bacterium]|jgi:16S rRNA (guanine1207-N2)-methyltransferase|nr:methyltransferase [Oscillospiraceae bacterium]
MPASRFSSHYFTPPPDTLHRPRSTTVTDGANELTFATDAGVFSRGGLDEGTRILLAAMKPFEPLTGRALDLGCGWGALGITLASRNPALDVTMSDVNPRAVLLTNENIRRNGLDESRARAVESDGLTNVSGIFDWILTNPPIRAGKPTVQRLILEAAARMMDAGRLILVWRKQQGAPSAMQWLGERFSRVERIDRESGYWVIMCGNERND